MNFRSKKFHSEKFDPNSLNQIDVDKDMDNLVEQITQEEKETIKNSECIASDQMNRSLDASIGASL